MILQLSKIRLWNTKRNSFSSLSALFRIPRSFVDDYSTIWTEVCWRRQVLIDFSNFFQFFPIFSNFFQFPPFYLNPFSGFIYLFLFIYLIFFLSLWEGRKERRKSWRIPERGFVRAGRKSVKFRLFLRYFRILEDFLILTFYFWSVGRAVRISRFVPSMERQGHRQGFFSFFFFPSLLKGGGGKNRGILCWEFLSPFCYLFCVCVCFTCFRILFLKFYTFPTILRDYWTLWGFEASARGLYGYKLIPL